MKRTISYILIAAIFALQLSGCGADQKEASGASDAEKRQDDNILDSQGSSAGSENVLDASTVLGLGRLDNSLDAYSRTVDTPLQVENPANAIEGGAAKAFLGASRAFYFKKHLLASADESWDEISFVTAEGEAGSERFDFEHQLWGAGPVAGTDHYLTFMEDPKESRYFLTERDENHEAVREIPLDFLKGSSFTEVIMSLSCFAADRSGVVHLVRQTSEGQQYLIISSEGEILTEYIPKESDIRELVPLQDGRVAFLSVNRQGGEDQSLLTTLQYMDAETGRPIPMAAPKKQLYLFTLLDENTLLYTDKEGVYRSDLSGNNAEPLYLWRNHGITAHGVAAIQADGEGRITLIYEGSESYNYLCIEPTTEEVEICEITMVVSSYSLYEPLVVEFNRRYPGCHIELKNIGFSDYDEVNTLLTELTAGKGPVLIGTNGIRFKDHEKLWEPLDAFMDQLGLTEELLPSALELGRINGSLYGIVTDFGLNTMVTGDPELKDWDYGAFLKCIEDRPELEAIFDQYDGDFGTIFIMNLLHGINDSYFWDGETGTTNFDSSEFRRALELAKKYCIREEGVSPGSSLLEGKVLCNRLYINKPEELALYRSCYGEDANYIGYPTKDGARHYIDGNFPLAIRRTATEKEKVVAGAFLSLCLSYEGQTLASKELNFRLSVRRDVLEEQIAAVDANTTVHVSGFDQFKVGSALNVELDRKTLLDMIDKAAVSEDLPMALRNIMLEELEAYFSGTITEDMLIDHLENRVGLYLGERS